MVGARVRVLITGAAGLVGAQIASTFTDHDVMALTRAQLDVTDRGEVLGICTGMTPDLVIHCAALTAVDDCEDQPEAAFSVNALGTRNIAEGARRVGAHLCYLSTDYVFDGTKTSAYLEWDEPNPISAYGRSKLGGERELDPGATIVRTSWVCGPGEQNFVALVLRLARACDELRFVADQRSRPTIAADLVRIVKQLAVDRRPGLFHVTNQGSASRFELARAIVKAAGLDEARVLPISASDLDPPQRAARPANSVLDNAALRLGGIPLLPDFHDSIERVVRGLAP